MSEVFNHQWIRAEHLKEEERLSHVKESVKERQKVQGILQFLEELQFPKEFVE